MEDKDGNISRMCVVDEAQAGPYFMAYFIIDVSQVLKHFATKSWCELPFLQDIHWISSRVGLCSCFRCPSFMASSYLR